MENWLYGPETLELRLGEVHVWRAYARQSKETMAELWTSLSYVEKDRASRFYLAKHKDRYVVAHGVLRDVLRRYRALVREPLGFVTNAYGKPELGGTNAGNAVRFSLSHSHLLVLVAVCREARIGVDTEHLKHAAGWPQISERLFSVSERSLLEATPEDKKKQVFLTCWTRREAYVKARGEGLSIPMSSFRIRTTPGGMMELEENQSLEGSGHWWVKDLFPDKEYVAALVVDGYQSPPLCWHWSGGASDSTY